MSMPLLRLLAPQALDDTGGLSKSQRACLGCNRKKTKCDMTWPSCWSCSKARVCCEYPTGRKKRTAHPKKVQRRDSLHQEIRNNFNSLSKLLEHGRKQGSGGNPEHNLPHHEACHVETDATLNQPTADGDFTNINNFLEAESSDARYSPQSMPGLNPQAKHSKSFAFQDTQNLSPMSFNISCSAATDIVQNRPANDDMSDSFSIASFGFSEVFQPWAKVTQGQTYRLLESPNIASQVSPSLPPEASPIYMIPPDIIHELVSLYFGKVHPFVPILHKPQFIEQYLSDPVAVLSRQAPSELPAALLLTCILALAARFSHSAYFNDVAPVNKGDGLAKVAQQLFVECQRNIQVPTLEYLQSCTLLAFYLYLSGPDTQGWMMIGTCTRLAYDLQIDTLDVADDDDLPAISTPSDNATLNWRRQEEMRRVWWSVWELDTFASAIACRPHTIDRTKMAVRLPVSDEAWFSDTPVESAVINPEPERAWHTLRGSPNQDQRAWFLLINYLLLVAHDLGQLRNPDPEDIDKIDNAVACYNLLLPPCMHLNSSVEPVSFHDDNFSQCNWIVLTNIMLQGCCVFIKFLRDTTSRLKVAASSHSLIAPLAGLDSQFRAHTGQYRPFTNAVFRIIKQWPPMYIPYSSPFIGCLVLGPAAIHLRVAIDRAKITSDGGVPSSTEIEMLKLVLGHIGRFWKIGLILLELATLVEISQASERELTNDAATFNVPPDSD